MTSLCVEEACVPCSNLSYPQWALVCMHGGYTLSLRACVCTGCEAIAEGPGHISIASAMLILSGRGEGLFECVRDGGRNRFS